MELRVLIAPFYAAALCGLCVAAVGFARSKAKEAWLHWPMALAGMVAIFSAFVASRFGLLPETWIGLATLQKLLGLVALVAAAVLAFQASRERARAERLLATAPLGVDEAVERFRAGELAEERLFQGRVGAAGQVTSPGGVVAAFYAAELRQVESDGAKGALLNAESNQASVVYLRGERAQAQVSFDPRQVQGPVQIRRCQVAGSMASTLGVAVVEGDVPSEALSYERVGKLGEPCVVLGRLARGPVEGSYRLTGSGGCALVLMGTDPVAVARGLAGRAWRRFGLSAALCVASAFLLSQSL
jgi:hypothetical protein